MTVLWIIKFIQVNHMIKIFPLKHSILIYYLENKTLSWFLLLISVYCDHKKIHRIFFYGLASWNIRFCISHHGKCYLCCIKARTFPWHVLGWNNFNISVIYNRSLFKKSSWNCIAVLIKISNFCKESRCCKFGKVLWKLNHN